MVWMREASSATCSAGLYKAAFSVTLVTNQAPDLLHSPILRILGVTPEPLSQVCRRCVGHSEQAAASIPRFVLSTYRVCLLTTSRLTRLIIRVPRIDTDDVFTVVLDLQGPKRSARRTIVRCTEIAVQRTNNEALFYERLEGSEIYRQCWIGRALTWCFWSQSVCPPYSHQHQLTILLPETLRDSTSRAVDAPCSIVPFHDE
jgi:hypothetical protein